MRCSAARRLPATLFGHRRGAARLALANSVSAGAALASSPAVPGRVVDNGNETWRAERHGGSCLNVLSRWHGMAIIKSVWQQHGLSSAYQIMALAAAAPTGVLAAYRAMKSRIVRRLFICSKYRSAILTVWRARGIVRAQQPSP